MRTSSSPPPGPLCAVFAPLLPLLSSAPLEEDDDPPTREHVAACAWCQQELAHYMAVDAALRRGYGEAAHESVLPFPFDLDGDEDGVEDYAFTLEDTLEATMAEGHDPRDQQPSTTTRSPRWGDRKRTLSPRATAIAGVAAALILAVIATTIYTQFAAHRTASPAATKTSGTFTKVALNPTSYYIWTTGPDGSFWYADRSHSAGIGRVTPDGTITSFPLPTDNAVTGLWINGMAVGSNGNVWISGEEDRGTTVTWFIRRMTPDGAYATIPLPADVAVGGMIAGPDDAVWFSGAKDPDPQTRLDVIGRVTADGHITTVPTLSQSRDALLGLCIGPDKALWYTWINSFSDLSKLTGRIGRVSPSGQIQEFAVPYAPGSIASGSDGALWYSELVYSSTGDSPTPVATRKGYVGHLTTAGAASELLINPNTRIGQLAAGSDGAIWYTVSGDQTGAFGRIAPSGGVETFSTHGNAQLDGIMAAPSALWLLDARNTLWHYRLPG
jgi:virginiamycin B lyase